MQSKKQMLVYCQDLLTIFEHCKISMAYWGEQVKLAHSGLAGQLPDGCPVPVPAPGANASAR